MPRFYSLLDKTNALARLDQNNGNVATTSDETGIPVRTLYAWRKDREQQNVLQSLQSQQTPPMLHTAPATPPPEFENDAAAYGFIREQVIRQLTTVATNLNMTAATPAQRLAALPVLLEYLHEVDKRIRGLAPPSKPSYTYTSPSYGPSSGEGRVTYLSYYRKTGEWLGPGDPPPLDDPPPEEEVYDPALSLTIRPRTS